MGILAKILEHKNKIDHVITREQRGKKHFRIYPEKEPTKKTKREKKKKLHEGLLGFQLAASHI